MKKFFIWLMKIFLLTVMAWTAGYIFIILMFTINFHSIFGTIFGISLPLFIIALILTLIGRLSYAVLMTKEEYAAASIPTKIGLYLCLLIPVAIVIGVLLCFV
ncbi:MAG: hypothetical protein K6B74_12355 [Ruminococcus sp.]|nr:hypothetical protein [Ruminococcus sp.]